MRLLVLAWQPVHPVNSGYRRRVIGLYGELAKHHEVSVLVPGGSGGLPFAQEIDPPEGWRGRLPKGRIWETFDPRFQNEVTRKALEWKPDAVLAEGLWAFPAAKAAARASGAPLGITVQNIEFRSAKGIYPFPVPQLLQAYERKVYRQADWLVAITQGEAELLRRTLGEAAPPIHVVPNGSTPPPSPPGVDRIKRVREVLGIGPEDRVILFVGRLNYPPNAKGLAWFSEEVYPVVRDQTVGVRWIAVGEPIPRHPKPPFEYVGYVEDLDAVCAAGTLAISPIRHGSGTSIKVLDLLARGLPLVATPESVRGLSGLAETGIRVGSSPEGWGLHLIELLNNGELREKLGVSGMAWVAANATWESVARRFSESLSDPVGVPAALSDNLPLEHP